MPFHLNGFLGEEAAQLSQATRETHRRLFSLCREYNKIAHQVLEAVKPKITEEGEVLVPILLFLRVLKGYAAVVLLIENGLAQEAGAIARSALESSYYLAKCFQSPGWYQQFWLSQFAEQEKQLADLANVSTGAKKAEYAKALDRLKRDIAKFKEEVPDAVIEPLNLYNVAMSLGQGETYALAIRSLSNENTHGSPSSLKKLIKHGPNGEIQSINYGFDRDFFATSLTAAAAALETATDALRKNFDIPQPPAEIETREKLKQETAKILEAQKNDRQNRP